MLILNLKWCLVKRFLEGIQSGEHELLFAWLTNALFGFIGFWWLAMVLLCSWTRQRWMAILLEFIFRQAWFPVDCGGLVLVMEDVMGQSATSVSPYATCWLYMITGKCHELSLKSDRFWMCCESPAMQSNFIWLTTLSRTVLPKT